MRRTLILLLGVAAMVPTQAAAQLCRGLPSKSVFAVGSRDDNGTLTGELGVGPFGWVGLSGNVARPKDQPNGSSSISYGGRVYWGGSREHWGLCLLSGFQIGYSLLINAEGLRANARLTATTIPMGVGIGRSVPIAKGVNLILFTLPQFLLHSHTLVLYDRADTLARVSSHPSDYGVDMGGGLQVGPVLVRGSAFRSKDLPWSWRMTAGFGL